MAWSSATQTGRLVVTVTGAIGPPPHPGEQSQVTAHSTPIVSWYGPLPGATSDEWRYVYEHVVDCASSGTPGW